VLLSPPIFGGEEQSGPGPVPSVLRNIYVLREGRGDIDAGIVESL